MRLQRLNQWVNQRSLAALDDAHSRSETIKAIERKHFSGQKIAESHVAGKTVYDYFKSILDKELLGIRIDLAQFRAGKFINSVTPDNEREAEILARLNFIEEVIGKYRSDDGELDSSLPLPSPAMNNSSSNTGIEGIPPPDPSNPRLFFQLPRRINTRSEAQVIEQLRVLKKQRTITIRYLILLVLIPWLVQWLSRDFFSYP